MVTDVDTARHSDIMTLEWKHKCSDQSYHGSAAQSRINQNGEFQPFKCVP